MSNLATEPQAKGSLFGAERSLPSWDKTPLDLSQFYLQTQLQTEKEVAEFIARPYTTWLTAAKPTDKEIKGFGNYAFLIAGDIKSKLTHLGLVHFIQYPLPTKKDIEQRNEAYTPFDLSKFTHAVIAERTLNILANAIIHFMHHGYSIDDSYFLGDIEKLTPYEYYSYLTAQSIGQSYPYCEKFWNTLIAPPKACPPDMPSALRALDHECRKLQTIFDHPDMSKIKHNYFVISSISRLLSMFPREVGFAFYEAIDETINSNPDTLLDWNHLIERVSEKNYALLRTSPLPCYKVSQSIERTADYAPTFLNVNTKSNKSTKSTKIVSCNTCPADHPGSQHISYCKSCKVGHPFRQHVNRLPATTPYCPCCYQGHPPGFHRSCHPENTLRTSLFTTTSAS